MKIFRKVFAITVALSALAMASSAMAANEASYENGVVKANATIEADVATVAVVPTAFGLDTGASDAIKYANQGTGEAMAAALAEGVGLTEDVSVPSNYEVRVGANGAVTNYVIPKFEVANINTDTNPDLADRIGFSGFVQANGAEAVKEIIFKLLSNIDGEASVTWVNDLDEVYNLKGDITFGLEIANVPAGATVTLQGVEVK